MARKRFKKIPLGVLLAAFVFIAITAGLILYARKPTPPVPTPTIKIYFIRDNKLAAAERPLTPTQTQFRQTIAGLINGPTVAERNAGLSTLIPPGTRVLHMRIQDNIAIIDFNRRLEGYGGGSARVEGIIAQIVYTATEVPGVEKAWIWIEGNKEIVLGGEGLVLDKPLSRADLNR